MQLGIMSKHLYRLGMVAEACNSITQEWRKEDEQSSHPWLHGEFKAALGHVRPCPPNQKMSTVQYKHTASIPNCTVLIDVLVKTCVAYANP